MAALVPFFVLYATATVVVQAVEAEHCQSEMILTAVKVPCYVLYCTV